MKITLVISSLGPGGAERVASDIASFWAERGDAVTIMTMEDTESDFYPLSDRVTRMGLSMRNRSANAVAALLSNLQRIRKLREHFNASRPNFVVSFMDTTNVVVRLAVIGMKIPVVASEHIDPRHYPIPLAWRLLRRIAYPFMSAVVILTESVRPWARRIVGNQRKVWVIPDPIDVRPVADRTSKVRNSVVAMGRLEPQKGFDLLLRAFAACSVTHPGLTLTIYGEGSQRSYLEQLRDELGIKELVSMPGITRSPRAAMARAELFVLSSRYEGLSLVLLEAMAEGTPVLSTRCPSGPEEIVQDGTNGLLVPKEDVQALAGAMDSLMSDGELRSRLAAVGRTTVQRFSFETIMPLWDELFASL